MKQPAGAGEGCGKVADMIECSRARRASLLTLDRSFARVAAKMTIDVVEVP
jgi:hypothetical protein